MRPAALLLLLAAVPVRADTLDDLKADHAAAEKAYYGDLRALPDTAAGAKDADTLWRAFDRGQAARFDAAVRLAMANPKSDRACEALTWVLTIPRAYYLDAGLPAFDLATTFHAANPKLGPAVAMVGRFTPNDRQHPRGTAAALLLLETVAAKNPDRTTRGQARAGLAYQAHSRFTVAEYKQSKDTDRLAAVAEVAYKALVRDYSDCRDLRSDSRTLGDVAHATLHELRNLRVGKVAPDIVGDDLDGRRLKLSDSRGKVTLLVFWGSWCGPCMAMVPQERALAERYAGKPFVIVGVNSDDDRAKARAVATREKMAWRSFWNGTDGPSGPISEAWNVAGWGWPVTYVIDAAGVIRYRGVFRDDLDTAVAELLAELDTK